MNAASRFSKTHCVVLKQTKGMVAIAGTYQNGQLKLEEEAPSAKPWKVIVTFLEEPVPVSDKRPLQWSDFSFDESREALKDYKGSLSDAVIEERREAL